MARPGLRAAAALTCLIAYASPAGAFDAFDGRFQAHGYFESQLRAINADFSEDWDVTQWYNVFNLELDLDIAPNGVGPFDLISAFVRFEVRYDCVYSQGCGMFRSINTYGNDSKSLPRRLSNATRNLYGGQIPRAFTTERTADGDRFEDPSDRRSIPIQFVDGERISGGNTDPVKLSKVNGFEGLARSAGANLRRGAPTEVCPTGVIGLQDGCNRFSGGKQQPGDQNLDGSSSANEFLRDPRTGELLRLPTDDPFLPLFQDLADYHFTQINGRGGSNAGQPVVVLGPWYPREFVQPIATFADRDNPFDDFGATPVQKAVAFDAELGDAYEEIFDTLTGPPSEGGLPPSLDRRFIADAMAKEQATTRAIAASVDVRGAGAQLFRPIPYTAPGSPGAATPLARGLYVPSPGLVREIESGRLDNWHYNLSQTDRAWNRGLAQRDEKELKEAYLDIEMLDNTLWLRIGKQSIVWGKTELFRTTDQLNPQDLSLTSLATLEESRIPLWSIRGVYSLYEVGPLQDVRVELALNYDNFQPSDIGACGEAYTVNATCSLSFGGFAHGFTGVGIAGVDLPPDPWSSLEGWEVGGRIEFRLGNWGVALSDFWGYGDLPYGRRIWTYERNVDPQTGRPRAAGARGPCVRNDVAGPITAIGTVAVGRDPACLRPGVTNRSLVTSGPLAGFATPKNNQYRSDPIAASLTSLPSRFFIRPDDPRRNPFRHDTFDSSLVALDAQGNPIRNPDGPFGFEPATAPDSGNALTAHHANLSLFNLTCASSAGFSELDPTACAPTIFSSQALPPAENVFDSVAELFARLLSGDTAAVFGGSPAIAGVVAPIVQLSNDSDFVPVFGGIFREEDVADLRSCFDRGFRCDEDEFNVQGIEQLNAFLTAEEEALLGCGPFWGTSCDRSGIDLLNAEASAVLQAFAGIDGTKNPAGGWRTDGLEPFVNPQSKQPGISPFLDPFLTDDQLEAAGRPRRYTQPGTLGFRGGAICTTNDFGGARDQVLPGCRTKWRSQEGRRSFVDSAGAAVDGLNLFDPALISLPDESRSEVRGVDVAGDHFCSLPANRSHPLCVGGPGAVTRTNPQGLKLGGEFDQRTDARSWSAFVDGNPDRIAFNPFGALDTPDGIAMVFAGCVNDPSLSLSRRKQLCGRPSTLGAGHPFSGHAFTSEIAALSWNLMTTLITFSDNYRSLLPDPDDPSEGDAPLAFAIFDPTDPDNYDNGDPATGNLVAPKDRKPICSFITPGHCSTLLAFLGFAGQKRNTIAAGGNGRYGRRVFGWHSGGEVVLTHQKRNVIGLGLDFNEDRTKTTWGLESTWISNVPAGDADSVSGITRINQFNLTLAVDRATFIRFLNPNRTFFMTTQWGFQYVDGWRKSFTGTGPWNLLGIISVSTGYFQDRLLPSFLAVYDVQSVSGAVLPQITYRFNQNFSAAVGAAFYFGRRRLVDMSVNPIGSAANRVDDRNPFKNSVESGLSILRNRDEVFLRIRYTF